MTFWSWIRGTLRTNTPRPRARFARARLGLEALEERLALSNSPLPDPDYLIWRNQTFSLGEAVLASPLDQSVRIDPQVLANGDFSSQASGFESLIGLDRVNASYDYRGQGYTVAVIDTGIDYRHAALGGGWGLRVVDGWDFANNDADPLDDNGHGTHVAGIIGSSSGTYPGVAPNVNLVALKVLGADGSGSFGAVEDALRWVINNQAKYNIVAINLSLGAGNYTSNPYTFLEDEFTTLKGQGVFIASASGNSFYSYGSAQGLGYPAISPNTVSVGAVWDGNFGSVTWASGAKDITTAPDRITSFTQRSSGLDILAPGALITNTYLNGGYQTMAGTSMASPVVAGAAVLIHQALDANGQAANANQNTILGIMKSTGVTLVDGDDENDNVTNTGLSFKRLDVYASLQSITHVNQAPTLAAIANQYLGDAALVVTMNGADPDGDVLTYSARVTGTQGSPAYILDQQLGLTYSSSYYTNSWGLQEKWMLGNSSTWYIILPNGELRKWAGSVSATMQSVNLMGTLGTEYYQDPSLLWNAQPPKSVPVSLSVSGNKLTITKTGTVASNFTVEVTVSDGKASAVRTFTVTPNNAPTLAQVANQTMTTRQDLISVTLSGQDADGDSLTYSGKVVVSGSQALSLQNGMKLRVDAGGYYENAHGMNEKWLYSDATFQWYCLLPNGELRKWAGSVSATSQTVNLVATLDASYWMDPALLWNASVRQTAPGVDVSTNGNTLTVNPVTGFVGSFVVEANVSDGKVTTRGFFAVTVAAVPNAAPTLATIGDQTMPARQTQLAITLSGSDADGDALTYGARLVTASAQAVQTQQNLRLRMDAGGYYQNAHGMNEKWLYSDASSQWYCLLPSGELRKWAGSVSATLQSANLVVSLEAAYWTDPTLLTNAQSRQSAPLVTVSLSGDRLTIDRASSYSGSFVIEATVSDGIALARRTFNVTAQEVTNTAPTLAAVTDQSMTSGQTRLTVSLTGSDADGDTLTYSARVVTASAQAVQTQQNLKLRMDAGGYYQNAHGMNEKWLYSDANSQWYCLLPHGELRKWAGSVSATLQSAYLVASLETAYWTDPTLLTNAQSRQSAPPVTVAVNGAQVTIDRAGSYSGSFVIEATVSDGIATTKRTFTVTAQAKTNTAPTLAAVADQTMTSGQTRLTVSLSGSDVDGDAIAYSARVVTASAQALQTQQNLRLRMDAGGYFQNAHGMNEKWLYSEATYQWYCLLPNGELRKWAGSVSGTMLAANLEATLDGACWTDPALLWNAQVRQSAAPVTLSISGNQLAIDRSGGYTGLFVIEAVVSDGTATAKRFFCVNAS